MKKYTIEQIFDWFADMEDFCHATYKSHVKKDKELKNKLPFERYCLIMFEQNMKEYDQLVKRTKKRM
jgi:hypothetical protein